MEPDLHDYLLLTTKLSMPLSYADVIVSRPHLYDKLTNGTRSPLSIIAAPAGSGKTTLLCAWLRQSTLSAAWVLLEERDNNSVSFWRYILAALKKNGWEIAESLQALLRLSPSSLYIGEDFFVAFINALMALPQDTWLVLDDYHTITSSIIHSELEFLLEHMPPKLHIVLISRTVPLLPLARLRAKGHLFELQATDLRFTVEETALFLKQRTNKTFSKDEIIALNDRLEGWATGLQLAALSLQRQHDFTAMDSFIRTFSGTNRSILKYFTEEVLVSVPEELQSFLLSTSIVKSFNASLCDEITARHDSDVMLEQLEHANLFLIHVDTPVGVGLAPTLTGFAPTLVSTLSPTQIWYRYHPLFADVLVYRLRHTQPELISTLYYRATCWYERHNMLPEAIETALLAGKMDLAAELIERCAWSLILQGQTARIATWITRIEGKTATIYRHHPLFCMINAAWQLQHGNIDKFKRLANIAEQAWQTQGNNAMLICLLALRAYQEVLCGDSKRAIAYAQEALSQAQSKHLDTAIPLVALGIGYLQNGNIDKAYVMLTSGYRMSKRNKHAMLITTCAFFLGEFFYATGNLQKAAEYYQLCIEDTSSDRTCYSEDILCCNAMAHTRQAEICYEWNDQEEANAHLQQSIRFTEENTQNWLNIEYYLMKAQLAFEHKAIYQTLEFLEKAEVDALRIQHRHYPALILLKRIRYLLATDKQDEAIAWFRQYEEHRNKQRSQTQHTLIESEWYCQAHARIILAEKQPLRTSFTSILKELEQSEQLARDQGRTQSELSFLIILAQAYHILKDMHKVRKTLERIVIIAEAGHYMRTLLDEGHTFLSLLARLYYRPQKRVSNEQQARCIAYVDTLLQIAGYLPTGKAIPSTHSRAANIMRNIATTPNQLPPVGTLSVREQEVLNLIAEGQSNQQIAHTLVVAECTIKTHLNNIYTKLHVNSRLQALAKAHACGLLEIH